MREEYLHHLFNTRSLGNIFQTTNQEILEVQDFGQLNSNAGPDFLNARVALNNIVWAGSIEFHVKSSDWYLHKHQNDKRYNNVIVHFVFEHDKEVEVNGIIVPTVELKSKIDINRYHKFIDLADSIKPIACQNQLNSVEPFVVFQQKERALFNRLLRKSNQIVNDIKRFNGDIEKAFYISLARTFGGKVNADAFENLICKINLVTLQKLSGNSTEAIMFGVSGLLPISSDEKYVQDLIDEFHFQKLRLGLTLMNGSEFRFSKMHPQGFPTIRLAQLAEILKTNFPLDQFISSQIQFAEIKKRLQIGPQPFWSKHYRFENTTKKKASKVSAAFADLIFINTLVPFLFAVGVEQSDANMKNRALELLSHIKSEENSIIRSWRKILIESKTAFDSQALIEQKNEFCLKKKCLFCTVGNKLLKS